jgi:hypothetical protein
MDDTTTTLADACAIVTHAHRLAAALAANCDMFGDTMTSLSCSEADSLTDLVAACGYPAQADLLTAAHADGDDHGDSHYPWVETDKRAGDLVVGDTIRDDFDQAAEVTDVTPTHHDSVAVEYSDGDGAPTVDVFDNDYVLTVLIDPKKEA